jgi:U3 small nucleolar RNA-associated protein 18
MPRQRSKKLAAARQSNNFSTTQRPEQTDSDNDSIGALEKDEEEEELARLVLGDGVGFKMQLDSHARFDMDSNSENGEGVDEEGSEGEAGLENVDDAEVSGITIWH